MTESIDRNYWRNFHFREETETIIKCPKCKDGYLFKTNIFETKETACSKERLLQDDYFENSDYLHRFVGFLNCNNKFCAEIYTVTGIVYLEDEPEEDQYGGYFMSNYKKYKPFIFTPSLEIFPLKLSYPEKVKAELIKSFNLFFLDIESCANKIRNTIEIILNELKVKKTIKNKNQKREYIFLHSRIKEFEKVNKEIGALLLSVKWIGNNGSHFDSLKIDDILDAYDFIKLALDKLFDKTEKDLFKKAKKINKTKKPISKLIKKKKNYQKELMKLNKNY